ncbi:MAG: hypothetical protein WC712_13140 [Candidatus Brocadiia bacterium]
MGQRILNESILNRLLPPALSRSKADAKETRLAALNRTNAMAI